MGAKKISSQTQPLPPKVQLNSMSTILLFGASGQQGNAIARRLQQQGHNIIAPVHSEISLAMLRERGIEATQSDFSVQSLLPLVKKADKIVLQVPVVITPTEMVAFAKNALEAIREAGSPHTVVNISSIIPTEKIGLAGPDTRLILKNMAFDILPNAIVLSSTLYLENFSQAYRQAIEHGGVIPQAIPAEIPVSYLSFDDLATYICAAVQRTEIRGKFFPIGGNAALTGTDLAQRLGAVIGKTLHYQAITHEELAAFLTPMIGEQTARQVAEMYRWEGTPGSPLLTVDAHNAQSLLGVMLPSFEEWAKTAFLN